MAHREVVADRIYVHQHLGAVADQVAFAQRLGDLAVLDEVGLGHAEHEVAGRRVHLPAAELGHIHAGGGVGDDVVGVNVAVRDEGVRHADHRQVRVTLATAVARRRAPVVPAPQPVPHVVAQHAVRDQHVALRGMALVVDSQRAPLGTHRAVIHQRHTLGSHLRAHPVTEYRRALAHQVGFEPVPAGLVKQHAAAAPGDHHGHLAARRRTGGQLGDGALCRALGQLGWVAVVEQLPPDCVAHGLAAGLQAAVAARHAAHREQRADLVVSRTDAMGVRHQDPAAAVGVTGGDLGDRFVGGARGLVRRPQQRHLAVRADAGRQHFDAGLRRAATTEGLHVHRPAPRRAGRHRRCRSCRVSQSLGRHVRRVGIARHIARCHPDPDAAVPTRVHFLDASLVEQHASRGSILREQLGPLATGMQGFPQSRINNVKVDERSGSGAVGSDGGGRRSHGVRRCRGLAAGISESSARRVSATHVPQCGHTIVRSHVKRFGREVRSGAATSAALSGLRGSAA